MNLSPRLFSVLALVMACTSLSPAAEKTMKFKVRGANPGGSGAYAGEVALTELSKTTAKIVWTTGEDKAVTEGIALRSDVNAIGAGYGGAALYALAIYELKGDTISAVWTTAAKPKETGTYALKGSDFVGKLSFADGTPGSVTFTPKADNLYKVVWNLSSGRYEGIGVRTGNVLVAASGDVTAGFGVAGYVPKGDDIEGRWAITTSKGAGTETWSLTDAAKVELTSPVGDKGGVLFDGERYVLKENKSAPGKSTSELREYLREGETFEGYRKMVALRLQPVKTDANTLAKGTLETVQKQYPGSYVKEIAMEGSAATILFIVVQGDLVELNLFRYKAGPKGIASAQFVLRNKPPYETQKKFKSEQDKNYDKWIEDIVALGNDAENLLVASAGVPIATAPAQPEKPAMDDKELAKAIAADFDKCGKLAQKFMGHLNAGEVEQAVGVMSDSAFTKVSREDFIKTIHASNKVFGAMKSFKPDRDSKDFGVVDGVMTFTLQADAEYANAKVRETLKFIREDDGTIEFIGYNRTVKE